MITPSSLTPAALTFLNGLNQIQQRTLKAQTQLTTGLKINTVSDAPGAIPGLFTTRAALDQVTQIDSNMSQVQDEVDTAQDAMQSAVKLVDQAQSLGTEGQTAFADANTRNDVAGQLEDVLQQMVNIANTNTGGRYLFSGDSDQSPAYSIDLTQANPISAYQGSAATRQVQAPDGTTFAVSKTAQEMFDSSDPTQNVFQSINALRTALLNNDQTGITNALGDVQSSGTYLNGELAFYGDVQDRVSNAQNTDGNLETQLKTQLSGIQDADMTQAITEFQQATLNQQAALQVEAQFPRTTLFDLLA